MTIYYVSSGSGDDSNSGTSLGSPKKTIANACGVADGGTGNIVEIIDSDTYHEGDIAISPNPITVRATGSNKPIIDGELNANDYVFTSNVSGNVYQGLTMRNYDNALINLYGWPPAGMDYMLTGCIGHFILGPQLIGGGGLAEVQSSLIVCDEKQAFQPYGNYPVWFNNSVLATNADGGPVVESQQSFVNITASFCTFLGNGSGSSDGRYWNLVNQVSKVINCIVSGTGDGINADSSTYNLVYVDGDPFIEWSGDDYDGTPRSANTGEITGNPLFVTGGMPGDIRFTSQNYDLQSTSPAAGAGIAYHSVATDQSGTARPDPPAIGAYEAAIGASWSDYYESTGSRYNASLLDRKFVKLLGEYRYKDSLPNRQAPFSLGIRGVPSLRNRKTAYSGSS